MHLYFNLFGRLIPAYGLMIVTGALLANIIALFLIRKYSLNFDDLIILECYGILGGFLGAKLLFLFVSRNTIEWNRFFNLNYFNTLMQGGFVFYGGLLAAPIFIFWAGRIHKINAFEYVKRTVALIPLAHCFGRIGCFCAGCCYGMPYHGVGAVTFPVDSFAVPNIPLFPIQLVEAFFLFLIFAVILFLQLKNDWDYTIESYLISYSTLRFCLEFFRYDSERGFLLGLSTSQWISMLIFIFTIIFIIKRRCNTL